MGISGDRYNEIGSHMRGTADRSGCITGTYVSAAGHAVGTYPLVGRCEAAAEPEHGTPLGWTAVWRNGRTDAGSVTSWSGQYYDDGPERICATWLLTASATAANTWKATAVGQDVFTREPPFQEQAARRPRHTGTVSEPNPAGEVTPV